LKTVITAVLAMRLIIQFIGQAVGVMLLRRRWPPERLPFKMWWYPLPALLTIVGWLWLFSHTGSAIWWGLLVIVLGLMVFLVQARIRKEWPFGAANSEVVE
jgi:amino acid transporter